MPSSTLLSLYFAIFLANFCFALRPPNSSTSCPAGSSSSKDVRKGEEGQICYQKAGENGGEPYIFEGKKIAGEPDSKIYKAQRFLSGDIEPADRGPGKAFAVKVVSTGSGAQSINLAKPQVMIRHELNMLEAFNNAERSRPVAEQSVVKLFGGGEVVDDTPMVVERANIPLSFELKREFSMIYVMEFGDQTLESHLAEWDRQLMNSSKANKEAKQFRAEVVDPQIGEEAEQLVVRLAQNLATFHKHALHLHLKPGNWIWVRSEDKWKFIDLQSAIPNFHLNDRILNASQNKFKFVRPDERFPDDLVEFACNSLSNELFLTQFIARANERPSTYASPEHMDACQRAHPLLRRHFFGNLSTGDRIRNTMSQQLGRIGPWSDVWSLGILFLEILAHTPQLNPPDRRQDPVDLFVKLRAEFVAHLLPMERPQLRQRMEELWHFRGRRPKVRVDGQKLEDTKLGKYMERVQMHFPAMFAALLVGFLGEMEK